MRHRPGVWNGIWSDMYIETTFTRYGKSRGGIVGLTMRPEAIMTWGLTLYISGSLVEDITHMRESNKSNSLESHKEEGKARIVADKHDRMSLEKKIDLCIHSFIPDQYPSNIVNIVTGGLSFPSVSVQNAVSIGTSRMRAFENSWPDRFHTAMQKKG